MNRRRADKFPVVSALLALLLGAAIFASCTRPSAGRDADGRLLVSVGIPPQQWLVEQIAGSRCRVNTLLSKNSDPETFEPEMSRLVDLQNSAVYFAIGGLPFEETAVKRVKEAFPGLKVVDTSQGIERIHGTHGHCRHGEEHEEFDPHIWTSVANARIMARNICNTLSALDPEGEQLYKENLKRLEMRLDKLAEQLDSLMAQSRGTSFLTGHPSLSYFARDYGLHQIALQKGEKEPTPADIAAFIDSARMRKAVAVVYDVSSSPSQLSAIAGDLHLPLEEVTLLSSSDWPEAMLRTAQIFSNSNCK